MRVFFLLSFLSAVYLTGCTSGSASTQNTQVAVSGVVQLGRVSGATVSFYRIIEGERGDLIKTTTTGSDGSFSASLPAISDPVEIVASGGTYIDEATGEVTDNDSISSLLEKIESTVEVPVTPFTHAIKENALDAMKNQGKSVSQAKGEAEDTVASNLGVEKSILKAIPARPDSLEDLSQATESERKAALALTKLSLAGNGDKALSRVVTEALTELGGSPTSSQRKAKIVSKLIRELGQASVASDFQSTWNSVSNQVMEIDHLKFNELDDSMKRTMMDCSYTLCGNSGNGCYDNTAAKTAGVACLPDGTQIEYVASGNGIFKIWKEKYGDERILKPTGLYSAPGDWQQKLNRSGIGFKSDYLTEKSALAGIACPPNVFLSHENMKATNRCLYYDSGNSGQRLNDSSGTEAADWLTLWNSPSSGRSTEASYFEGNVKTCADKGMRLPTLYETTVTIDPLDMSLPTGDGDISPAWAQANGVPSFISSWTASASNQDTGKFWFWSDSTSDYENYDRGSGYTTGEVRCVLPSSGE